MLSCIHPYLVPEMFVGAARQKRICKQAKQYMLPDLAPPLVDPFAKSGSCVAMNTGQCL